MSDFEAALSLLGPNGERWHQGDDSKTYPDGTEKICALEACYRVAGYHSGQDIEGDFDKYLKMRIKLASIVNEQFADRTKRHLLADGATVAEFNDHHDTTFDDVRTVFEKARARLEEQGA